MENNTFSKEKAKEYFMYNYLLSGAGTHSPIFMESYSEKPNIPDAEKEANSFSGWEPIDALFDSMSEVGKSVFIGIENFGNIFENTFDQLFSPTTKDKKIK